MSLRILGGDLRGRLLQTPRGSQTRPTTSMLRKAVFDILQNDIGDTHFLDLFAGSGAIGIEALSRGAHHTTFIESHRVALCCLKKNLADLHLEDRATVYPLDVFEGLKKLEKKGETFQIVYADPPYHRESIYQELLTFLDASTLLATGSLLFLEAPSPLNETSLHLSLIDRRRFGTSHLHQYRYVR